MVCMYILFNRTNIDSYGITNWLYSYKYGFSKRALLGTIFNALLGDNLSVDEFKCYIKIVHNIAIIIFVLLILIVFNITNRSLYVLILFISFLTSMYVRNIFSLVGYVDIWVTNLILSALIFSFINKYKLIFLCVIISGFVHELTIFFAPALFIFLLLDFSFKNKFNFLFICVLSCCIIFFISSFFYSKDVLMMILSIYPEIYSNDHIDVISNAILKHYSISKLIFDRFKTIYEYLNNEIFAFVFYGITSLVLLTITLRKIKTNFTLSYLFIIAFVAILPCFITFIATDLWRVASYYNFTIYIVTLSIYKKSFISLDVRAWSKFIKVILFVALFFQCSLPYIQFSRENAGFIDSYYCKYNSLITDTFIYNIAKILVYNYTFNDSYKNYNKEGPYHCLASGNRSLSLILYPGNNRIKFYTNHNDDLHFIGINAKKYVIDKNETVLYIFQSMDRAVIGATNVFCLPGKDDWLINKVEVELIE